MCVCKESVTGNECISLLQGHVSCAAAGCNARCLVLHSTTLAWLHAVRALRHAHILLLRVGSSSTGSSGRPRCVCVLARVHAMPNCCLRHYG